MRRSGAGGLRLLGRLACRLARNRVLSMRPWKIGHAHLHALADHLPAVESCLAGELGGRQVNGHRRGPPMDRLHRGYTASRGRAQRVRPERPRMRFGPFQTGFGTSTNSWRTPKRSATSSPRRRIAERLGGVVAGGDEVDAGLLRLTHGLLGGFAGEEGVQPGIDGVVQVPGCLRPRRSRSCDALGAAGEHQRLALGQGSHALEQLLGVGSWSGKRAAIPIASPRWRPNGCGLGAQALGDQRVVARPAGGRRAAGGRRPG